MKTQLDLPQDPRELVCLVKKERLRQAKEDERVRQEKNEVLEKAARVCEDVLEEWRKGHHVTFQCCATRIRAMKE
jgi:hypothetical protein